MDKPRYWRPLKELTRDQMHLRIEVVRETAQHYGLSEEAARAKLDGEFAKCRYYVNDLYQIEVTQHGQITQLCIRRRDGSAVLKDWRHFQQIKNELCGPEREGFEIYPAESRKVDTSNKYHIWVLPEGAGFDLGWKTRDVQYDERKDVPGLRQRSL